jgi:hypothetical protein
MEFVYCHTFTLVYLCFGSAFIILLYAQVCRLCGCEWDMRIVTEKQDVQIWLHFYFERVSTGDPERLRRYALLTF